MIKVSIIVPVYNVARFIESCVDSIMSQTYPFIECIFIDDCTLDNSIFLIKEKLKDYTGNKEFEIIYHEKNSGAAAARNLGLKKATGDYIYFLDSDDVIYPHCISSLVDFVNWHPNVDIVLGDMECQDPVLNKLFTSEGKDFPLYSDDRYWIHDNFLVNISVSPCNKLIKSDLIKVHSLYFEEGIVNEDVLWQFILSKYVKAIAFCKQKTYYYSYNSDSVTASLENEEEHVKSWMIVLDFYSDNIDKNLKWIENFSLLKLFHHVRLYKVSQNNKDVLEGEVLMRLRSMIRNRNTPLIFKPMYLLLKYPVSFLTRIYFIWNKCLGILYRISKWQDKEVIRKLMKSEKPAFIKAF